ncbi:NAD(P)-dependent oxidoreductase [Shewanella sairae]|uniref:NAD(P)-dependent oxidoreductase n=1 Tax=Shewanella sairae TaxID=190310 RepID=A0ABQ4PJF0_9GAMM|nr:SDR family oxidoreductase [Shewanella sairae]MCL1130726.1 SDR family oxidoreductase [Shewanella sairae]GIU47845.1 NAD(P)-dependent oxidoreductase [Shewanella sairae]
MIKTISIVGCGWFGFPLAKALKNLNLEVFGSKRNSQDALGLKAFGIRGFKLDLDDDVHLQESEAEIKAALATDALVVNIPPALRKAPEAYLKRLAKLQKLINGHKYKKLIFVSTTGVYPDQDKELSEHEAAAHSDVSNKLLQAEAMFVNEPNCTIVRFAGLVGPKRHPGRFLAGKSDLSGENSAVNLVHLNDCVKAISALLSTESTSRIYNVCAPIHPSRKAFYTQAASNIGLIAPQFLNDGNCQSRVSGKVISSEKLITELDFTYQFSDPMDMLSAC